MEFSYQLHQLGKSFEMSKLPLINSGSMADVAFTLLIFFLVSTTLAVDKGTKVVLPPFEPCDLPDCSIDVNDSDVLVISLLPEGKVLLEGVGIQNPNLSTEIFDFLSNYGKNPEYSASPQSAVIVMELDPNSTYETYLETLSTVRAAYLKLRNIESNSSYALNFEQLSSAQASEIRKVVPMKIVEQPIQKD